MDDIIADLFHSTRHSIHRLGMELELVSMVWEQAPTPRKRAE